VHQVVPRLRASGGGSITITTTIATERVIVWDGMSAFSKGAVQALVRQVAAEEGPNGIRCNDVGISWIVDMPAVTPTGRPDSLASPGRERTEELLDAPGPALRPGRVGSSVFPSANPLPSTTSATGPPALFGGFAGTTRLSDFPRSSISGAGPWPSLSGPPGDHPNGRARDLPVLAHGGSVHAQGL
jgi:hypothetical protein